MGILQTLMQQTKNVVGSVKTAGVDSIDAVKNAYGTASAKVSQGKNILKNAYNTNTAKVSTAYNNSLNAVTNTYNTSKNNVLSGYNTASNTVSNVYNRAASTASNAYSTAASNVSNTYNTASSAVSSATAYTLGKGISGAAQVVSGARSVYNSRQQIYDKVTDKAGDILVGALDKGTAAIDNTMNYARSVVDTPLYDQMASSSIASKIAKQGYDQGYVDTMKTSVFKGKDLTSEQETVFNKVSGREAFGKDETAGSVIDDALKNKNIDEYQAESMRHFFSNEKNAGKEYSAGSIQNWFKNYDNQMTEGGMSAKEASTLGSTPLETASPLNKLFGNDTTAMGDIGGIAAAGLIGGVAGGLMNDNFEGGVVAGAVIGSMGKGIGRVINNNFRNIEDSMINSVLGKGAVKEGDEFGETMFRGYKDDTLAGKAGLTSGSKYDPKTGKYTDAGGKEINPNFNSLTMQELGLMKAGDTEASNTLGVFTKKVISAEQGQLKKLSPASSDIQYNVGTNKGAKTAIDSSQPVGPQYMQARQTQLDNVSKADATRTSEMNLRSKAVTLDSSNNPTLNPEFLKDDAANNFIKNNINMGKEKYTKEGARAANLKSIAAKDDSELGYAGSYMKNKLTNNGGAGSIGMQSRYMALSGAMLGGVGFTSKTNDHRRGFNANRGNRI